VDAPHGNNINVIIGIILVRRFLWPVCAVWLWLSTFIFVRLQLFQCAYILVTVVQMVKVD